MRKLLILTFGLLLAIYAQAGKKPDIQAKLAFIVQKLFPINETQLKVYLDWESIIDRIGSIDKTKILIVDLNNNNVIKPQFVDKDQNGTPEAIYFVTAFDGNESVRGFLLQEQEKPVDGISTLTSIPETDTLKITYLTEIKSYFKTHVEPVKWSETIAKSILTTYPNPSDLEIYSAGRWSYTNGFFLNALSEIQSRTKNQEYYTYIKNWTDLFVAKNGKINPEKYDREIFELDNIPPGRLLIYLNQLTGDERYRKAADELIDQLNHQPKTSDGGFWHKKVYTNQMWLDGIYMADVYLAQYADAFKQPKYFDEAVKQMELMYKHTLDSRTGLMYHGWDESKNKVWADPQTGASPEFWGRAIGWYMMAMVDGLDYIPAEHPKRATILKMFKDLSYSLSKYQDTTGMWYQGVDKGDKPGNWLESSGSAMIAYAYAKGYAKGYLGTEYHDKAKKAFEGLKNNEVYFDDQGKFYLSGTVKVGTLNLKVSKGDFNYYIGVDRRINDFKGVAAFMYLAIALEDIEAGVGVMK